MRSSQQPFLSSRSVTDSPLLRAIQFQFFQFSFKAQNLRPLIFILLTPPCLHHFFLGNTLLTAEHRAAEGSPAVLWTTEGLILMSCRTSFVFSPRACALLQRGSAPLTHAALWFTLGPPLQGCYQALVLIPQLGSCSHLRGGKCVWIRMLMGATGASLPEPPISCTALGPRKEGREGMHKDKVSVFLKFKICLQVSQHAIKALSIVLECVHSFVFTLCYSAFFSLTPPRKSSFSHTSCECCKSSSELIYLLDSNRKAIILTSKTSIKKGGNQLSFQLE